MQVDVQSDVRPPLINCETPLGAALINLFRAVESELIHESAPPSALAVVIFGGCAVHLYTSHRVSVDVDAELVEFAMPATIDVRALLAAAAQPFLDGRSGRVFELSYDLSFTTSLGPLHEDYLERAICLEAFGPLSPVKVMAASPVDLAISNLGRGTEQDISDIFALLRTGFILASKFECLALEAIDCYVGNHEPPTSILRNILQDYLELSNEECC